MHERPYLRVLARDPHKIAKALRVVALDHDAHAHAGALPSRPQEIQRGQVPRPRPPILSKKP